MSPSLKLLATSCTIGIGLLLSACQSNSNPAHSSSTHVTPSKPLQYDSTTMPKISVQLWSVKDAVKRDFEGTLTQLASMGFQGVEFAGEFGRFKQDPQGLKAFLDSLGLQASAAHVGMDQLLGSQFEKTVNFYQTIGVKTLIDPWEERVWQAKNRQAAADDLNTLAKKLKPYGMQIGYHNHAQEFADYEEATYWDYLARNTTDDVVLQLDVGWVQYAGKDPIEYVKRYPGRTKTTHYKIVLPKSNPQNYSAIIGQDMIDWLNLSRANIAVGGTEWFVVEQETYPEGLTPLESVALSKAGLDNILKQL
ncbi:sugar phosphate isomerase/epimerase [Saccharobesus litoralis]|uniref:Sugar phosphate isomerase/epimerase n=1 Tax=Saccharobesus litoralis TaxID=2172099 RepID=A0A2S0VR11_9ALTE|nr:sugar phosphate isomerase/epimerase [Saccharobesus litoralis]AWB66658.1 sugar phosphate isomerase/epimerase [Saccharobesus litoralis]